MCNWLPLALADLATQLSQVVPTKGGSMRTISKISEKWLIPARKVNIIHPCTWLQYLNLVTNSSFPRSFVMPIIFSTKRGHPLSSIIKHFMLSSISFLISCSASSPGITDRLGFLLITDRVIQSTNFSRSTFSNGTQPCSSSVVCKGVLQFSIINLIYSNN